MKEVVHRFWQTIYSFFSHKTRWVRSDLYGGKKRPITATEHISGSDVHKHVVTNIPQLSVEVLGFIPAHLSATRVWDVIFLGEVCGELCSAALPDVHLLHLTKGWSCLTCSAFCLSDSCVGFDMWSFQTSRRKGLVRRLHSTEQVWLKKTNEQKKSCMFEFTWIKLKVFLFSGWNRLFLFVFLASCFLERALVGTSDRKATEGIWERWRRETLRTLTNIQAHPVGTFR